MLKGLNCPKPPPSSVGVAPLPGRAGSGAGIGGPPGTAGPNGAIVFGPCGTRKLPSVGLIELGFTKGNKLCGN